MKARRLVAEIVHLTQVTVERRKLGMQPPKSPTEARSIDGRVCLRDVGDPF